MHSIAKYYNQGEKDNKLSDREKEVNETFRIDKMVQVADESMKGSKEMGNDDTSIVVDDVIDACFKQYPKRIYLPGVNGMFAILVKLPLPLLDRFNWMQTSANKKKVDDL